MLREFSNYPLGALALVREMAHPRTEKDSDQGDSNPRPSDFNIK